jgi:hypothetical protein
MCKFSARMRLLGVLDSAFNVLCGGRVATFKLGSPTCEFFSSRRDCRVVAAYKER